MDMHREAYREEAYELLAELESSLLELEETPDDEELIGRVFRAMHTIKGSGAMFGFDDIADFTHDVETVFDLVRAGKIAVTKRIVDLTLSACDQIRKMVDGEAMDKAKADEIIEAFREMLPHANAPDDIRQQPVSNKKEPDACQKHVTFRIRFRPAPGILATGTNPLLLLDELRELGECKIVAQTDALPQLTDLNPEFCYLYWDMILTTVQDANSVRDVFIFVEDECEINIELIDEGGTFEEEEDYKRLGEILIERGDLSSDDLGRALGTQKKIGKILVETDTVGPGALESALMEQQHVTEVRVKRKKEALVSSIRVTSDKLDSLIDLVGELVIAQERLNQAALGRNDPELILIAEEMERMTSELRDNTMSIRMLPIGTTFTKFKRLVRDLSDELNKEVIMTTAGGETELDKTVIEQLNDPLVHIIRNSIDHGIEPPDTREAAGKPRQGTVHIKAFHSGANVLIQISDDGAGLDKETIYARSVERGLIQPGAELSDKEIFSMIFQPGFSTAKNVTSVSGRGVGMDVVKRGIESLRGSVDINSRQGAGTTITLKLPLTLAIIDGIMVNIGEGNYVLPLAAVEECIELHRADVKKSNGRQIVNLRGEIVPYISLRKMFNVSGDPPDIEQIVIAEVNGERIGFEVDRVVGEYQTVIKALGGLYRNSEGFSGATILGDGTVALILELPKLVQITEMEEQK